MRRTSGVRRRSGLVPGVAGIMGVVGLLWLVLVAAPPWFVHDRTLEGLKAQNEVRTTLLQGLGGLVLLVGAYFTYRQVTNSRAQLEVAQQGQITERFTRAIDQLGHAQLDVRLGGIYALERIARDSPADRATIGEVLTAFVRSHSPWPPRLPGQYRATAPIDEVPELQVRAADVQAILTVLGRGGFAQLEDKAARLDLHAVDLRRAHLGGAHLERANLVGAHLEGVNLYGAHLEGAELYGAHLEEATLMGAYLKGTRLVFARLEAATFDRAHMEKADLYGAHLEGAELYDAHLERAYFGNANLEGATLMGAHLEGTILVLTHLEGTNLGNANLEGATLQDVHLERADLRGADLKGATVHKGTSWPEGFDWQAAGVILVEEDIQKDT